MKQNKVERHIIKKSHRMFEICSTYTMYSKNLYNHTNYIVRQEFIKNGIFLTYKQTQKIMKTEPSFKTIGSNSGQMTLRLLEKNWKSYFIAIKEWSKYPSKFLGKPKLPKYLDKDKGRLVCQLTNLQTRIEDGYLFFAFKPFKPFNSMIRTKVVDKLLQVRIVPKNGYYVLEIVYEINVPVAVELDKRIIGIDLGLNNLMTIQNNFGEKPFVVNGRPLKSINSYYNVKKSKIQSELKKVNGEDWSYRLSKLTMKRDNKVSNYFHKASKYIVNYCRAFNVDTVVIGKNKKWKQGFKRQKGFIQVPFENLIHQLRYKLREHGIKTVLTEESYTSKANFINNDEMKKGVKFSGERIERGLYKTNNDVLINADVNGAGNIIRKVFPEAFNGVEDLHLHPSIVNL